MPVQGGQKYPAKVVQAGMVPSKPGKSPAIRIYFQTPDGVIKQDFYLSPNARPYTAKKLKAIGASDKHLADSDFWENPESVLMDKECEIVTETEPASGDFPERVKIAFVNPATERISKSESVSLASLFGGGSHVESGEASRVSDDDVPF